MFLPDPATSQTKRADIANTARVETSVYNIECNVFILVHYVSLRIRIKLCGIHGCYV
jgi:hypothetical protein